ncbi:MAG: DUF2946 domain-containing protein [Burkholderiaceae bacterium]|nr:DUF2946 domain-containing protein [Burkholderiaceae bacterium]
MPYFLSSRLRKTLAWLALCGMCFGAVAPGVSKWLAATRQAADWVAVCDGHGIERVPATQLQAQAGQGTQQNHHHGSSPGGGQSDDDGDCCPYCTLIHHSPWVPVVAAAFAPHALPLVAHYPAADVPTPALRAGRRPQMPQAPPLV